MIKKEFKEITKDLNADIICLQETKISSKIKNFKMDEYFEYYNYSKRTGYSGVAIFTKKEPVSVLYGMKLENEYGEIEDFDIESRIITLEYDSFYIVSVYVPSSQLQDRKDFRLKFDYNFLRYIEKLNNIKDVIICGDFNICHTNIDVCNTKKHQFIDTFSDEEKSNFNEILEQGFIDTYRYMHPQMRKYTFWTNEIIDRKNSESGWRLDYILVSEFLKTNIRQANILNQIICSDHCPIELVLKV